MHQQVVPGPRVGSGPERDGRIGRTEVGDERPEEQGRKAEQCRGRHERFGQRTDVDAALAPDEIPGGGHAAEEQVGRPVPGVGRAQDADGQRPDQPQDQRLQPARALARSLPARQQREADGPAEGQHRERHAEHVGVQVGIEEGEVGELGDRLHLAGIGVDGPRGQPEPVSGVDGRGPAAEHLDAAVQRAGGAADERHLLQFGRAGEIPGIADDRHLGQIAQQQGQDDGDQTGGGGRPGRRSRLEEPGTFLTGPLRGYDQIPGQTEHGQAGHAEQQRQDKVIGDGGHHAEQLGDRSGEHEAIIIVVDVAAGVPRVIGWEGGRAHDGREIGQVHRLLAAPDDIPDIGIAQPDGDHQGK